MPLDTIMTELKAARFNPGTCSDIKDLGRMLVNYQNTVQNQFEELVTNIINIINNGGGGATSPVFVIRAVVNQLGGVPASQVDFPFDGETLIFTGTGLSPVFDETHPRIARNPGRYLQDNEVVELTSFNGSLWLADKISDNTIAARVVGNVATGDLTFDFDGAVALSTAPAPAGGTGKGVNITGNAYSNDEVLVLKLVENPEVLIAAGLAADAQAWAVVQDDDEEGGGGATSYAADLGIDDAKLSNGKIALFDNNYEDDKNDSMVYGHVGGVFGFRGMASLALATLNESITEATATFEVIDYLRLCGVFPTGTVLNSIDAILPQGQRVLIGRVWDEDEWHLLAAVPVTRIARGVVAERVPARTSTDQPSITGRVVPTVLLNDPIRYEPDPTFAGPLLAINGASIEMEIGAHVPGNIVKVGKEFVFEVLVTDLNGLPGRDPSANQSIGSDGAGDNAGEVMWQDDGACG